MKETTNFDPVIEDNIEQTIDKYLYLHINKKCLGVKFYIVFSSFLFFNDKCYSLLLQSRNSSME